MLILVEWQSGLAWSKSHQFAHLDIVIQIIDIGIGMMDHIMLDIPEEMAGAQHTHGVTGKTIATLMGRKTTMATIMHDIETYCCYQKAQQDTFGIGNSPMGLEYKQMANGKCE